MQFKRALAALAVAASCAAGLAACGGDDDDNSSAATSSAPAATGSGSTSTPTASTGQVDPSKPPVHIALITIKIPGSDLFTPYGVGANAAANAINAEGGFGGRKVVIDTCNSQNTASIVSSCAQKLIQKKPVAFVGCDNVMSVAGQPIFKRQGIPGIWCLNTAEDFKNPLMFGVDPGGVGQQIAMARKLCDRSDVKTVAIQNLEIPQLHSYEPPVKKILNDCGKTIKYIYMPLTAADFTPYLNEILAAKPDFVMTFLLSGPQTVQVFKAFQAAGYPASKMFTMSSSLDYATMLKPAGGAMNGVTMFLPYANPVDPDNPDFAAYKAALQGTSADPFNSNVQTGYVYVNTVYTAAQKIGFDKFDSASLTQFLSTQTGVHLPMNRELVNPGPTDQPQIKQPYAQMVQWDGTKLNTITEGTEAGWVKATP
jgi:ABC-type branched-subunit amino acid transport system substrate-binding protein